MRKSGYGIYVGSLFLGFITLHAKLNSAVYHYLQLAGRRCVFVALWVCYHDDSKLHVSILTNLGL